MDAGDDVPRSCTSKPSVASAFEIFSFISKPAWSDAIGMRSFMRPSALARPLRPRPGESAHRREAPLGELVGGLVLGIPFSFAMAYTPRSVSKISSAFRSARSRIQPASSLYTLITPPAFAHEVGRVEDVPLLQRLAVLARLEQLVVRAAADDLDLQPAGWCRR